VWTSREAALDALFERCRASPECRRAMPDPAATLDEIGRALGSKRELTIADPSTGEPRRVPATADTILGLLQPLLYTPETVALVPALLARARDGDFAPLVAAAAALTGDLSRQMNVPLHYSVTCTEDVPRIGAGRREQVLAGKRSAQLARMTLAICDAWPRGRAPAGADADVATDVPVLILSGGLDPVTPAAHGTEVARSLRQHRHVIAPGYGHIVSPHACAPRLIAAFVADGGFAALPDDCVKQLEASKPPALWTGLLGPATP
jgi:pimeloyl-ACP methyl ester carboxylesterase